jgi:predicted alpha/beta-fold hydrolase
MQQALWLPGGHVQTIWGAKLARTHDGRLAPMQRQRWTTPDGDWIDVDIQQTLSENRPHLVLFHGLEGSSQSHYAQAFRRWAQLERVNLWIPHFRGCSGQDNDLPRAYHSGDHAEIDWILAQVMKHAQEAKVCAAGVSLGGNALMLWAGLQGQRASNKVHAVASISSPLDLMGSGLALGQGLNRWLYTPMFLKTMKAKAQRKAKRFSQSFDLQRALQAKDLYAFDDAFTAPVHGFADVRDYWTRASAKPHLTGITVPALILNARNDPFVPAWTLPDQQAVSPEVTLWQPAQGGHVGFVQGYFPGQVWGLADDVGKWLLQASGQQE